MLTCVLNGGILVDEVNDMEFGINIGYVSNMVGMEKAAELIAKTGFTCVDYTPPVKKDDWKEIFESDIQIIKKYGLRVEQTHGPFNRYGSYGETHAQAIERVYEATVLSGAKFIAIHGDEYPDNTPFDEETALKYNHDMYLPYIKRAEKDGIKLAFETVFEDGYKGLRRFCSKAEELVALIESFNSPAAVCCMDFGHLYAQYKENHVEEFRKLAPYIQCTHTHDNHGSDQHEMPFMGKVEWETCVKLMKEAGYNGSICLEYVYGKMPEEILEKYLKLSHEVCELIWK